MHPAPLFFQINKPSLKELPNCPAELLMGQTTPSSLFVGKRKRFIDINEPILPASCLAHNPLFKHPDKNFYGGRILD